MADELADAVVRADRDDDVRVVVLTGAGTDFCVGADLSGGGLGSSEDAAAEGWVEPASRVSCGRCIESSKPVIAAVRGAAVGVGSTMILAADYRIAADRRPVRVRLRPPWIFPEGASTWFLPRHRRARAARSTG